MSYLGNAIATYDALVSTSALSHPECPARPRRSLDNDFETISLIHEQSAGILWCYMNQPGKPVVTHALLDELLEMQAAVR
ncbi:MAG: hypothetical protein JO326_01555, partial [Acetobacteraceae bacterium]|nr:hypothetical protein [Acetobacteraceae bacterium]